MDPSILEQLREQTRPAHLALEAQPLLQRLLSSRLTETEYVQLLQAMLAFYQAIEPELIPATETLLRRHPDTAYRYFPRVPLLVNDCRVLGCASSGFIVPPVELWLEESDAYLLGVLYVIEGATQGGKLIARHLADTLGVSEDSGASFFNQHRRGDSWADFRRGFDRGLVHNCQNDINRAVDGADRTFSALHAHLDRWQGVVHGR